MKPEISVIMPVYNSEETISYAVESVLSQTFDKFEFMVIDDGSTDKTLDILSSFSFDDRLVIFKKEHNYIASINYGLEHANGKYIARMDADDYMHPERLRIQWQFMEHNEDIDICGTWMHTYGLSHKTYYNYSGIVHNLVYKMLQGNPIFHPTVMMRNDVIKTHRLIYENYDLAEDYKLWFEAAKHNLSFYIIPIVLHYYKHSIKQGADIHKQIQSSHRIKEEILEFIINQQSNIFIKDFLITAYKLYKNEFITLDKICKIFISINEMLYEQHISTIIPNE